ncbi:hypothetical protein K488DRAFT_84440 [Vararia minispora EC-137]|uniref:Uncharacterized protein n=1 Tax=Vararia minispora EC-137 TaxID=1314806 RepID=A0ACB8QQ66_9AGAM|nr:hypothetical protein K488DRAFT_84440 [Vararia minispora EC-137]
MPGLTPTQPTPSTFVVHHSSAADFLSATFPTLARHEASANIILAHALKLVGAEAALTGCHFTDEADARRSLRSLRSAIKARPHHPGPFWLTVWSAQSPTAAPSLELVLSSVSNTLGDYPIFLWTPRSPSQISTSWLLPRIEILTDQLYDCVPPSRVFSVFGMTALVKMFARVWTELVDVPVEPEPFYSAYYTYCNWHTFRDLQTRMPDGHDIRRAVDRDLEGVAQLCKEFADDSIYFPLSIERARIEARELIAKGLIWIYEAESEVTTICAVTRSSHNVSAITKVYTTPKWRRRGFAEHLVRDVTRRLLSCGKSSVTLYVGHSNGAQRVYDRVGFVGLCGKDKPTGVEDALELGFATGSSRGHW